MFYTAAIIASSRHGPECLDSAWLCASPLGPGSGRGRRTNVQQPTSPFFQGALIGRFRNMPTTCTLPMGGSLPRNLPVRVHAAAAWAERRVGSQSSLDNGDGLPGREQRSALPARQNTAQKKRLVIDKLQLTMSLC